MTSDLVPPALGSAIYFDTDLSADAGPLAALWERLTPAVPADRLTQWTTSEKTQQVGKSVPFNAASLLRAIERGTVASVAAETTPATPDPERLLVLAQTTPVAKLREGIPRHWRYNAVVALGPALLDRLGRQAVIDAIVAFADSVAVKAGVILWAESTSYASALAMGAGGGLTSAQERRVADSVYWRSYWGNIIRGPTWGTFLSAAHVAEIGGLATVRDMCARVSSLATGGAFLQLTDLDKPVFEDNMTRELAALCDTLRPIREHT